MPTFQETLHVFHVCLHGLWLPTVGWSFRRQLQTGNSPVIVGSIQLPDFYGGHFSLLCRDCLCSISAWWRWWIWSSTWLHADMCRFGPGQGGSVASLTASVQQGRHVLQATRSITHLNDDHGLVHSDPHALISLCTTNAWERNNECVLPFVQTSLILLPASVWGEILIRPRHSVEGKKIPCGISQCKLSTGDPSEGFETGWIQAPHIVSKHRLHSILL